ncbi:MAG: DUF4248 domain-containing protein [Bacteroidales bacterium]|nr:DUF4248 domain-containing protein [Bacteroidales bacterium]
MKRTALALLYFPDATPRNARRRLTEWIHHCPELYALLTKGGRKFDGRQELTAREVRLIQQYLGEP